MLAGICGMSFDSNDMYCDVDSFMDPITRQEEREKIALFKSLPIDSDLRSALAGSIIRCNLRFLKSYANSYSRKWGADHNELYSAGKLGMLEALESFNMDKNVKFISYAVWHIKKSFVSVMKQRDVIRHNQNKRSVAKMKLEDHLNPLNFRYDSMDKPVGDGDDTTTLGAMIPDENEDIESALIETREFSLIREALGNIDERRRLVLEMSYGFNGNDIMGMKAIGEHLGISMERARQIRDKALIDFKKALLRLDPDFKIKL